MQTDTGTQKPVLQTLHVCRFGQHADAEVPSMKSWALIQILMKNDGTKVETGLKNFGMNGKDDCEKEAKRLDDEAKAAK